MPSGRRARSRARLALRIDSGRSPQIVAVHCKYNEGAELHLFIVPAGMQGIEIGISVNAQDNRLAIDYEMLLAVLQCSFDDPGEAAGPVVTTPGDQADAIAIQL
jgi:hypothetical protein